MHCNVGLISGLYLIRYALGLAALLALVGFKGYFTVEFHKALKLQPRNLLILLSIKRLNMVHFSLQVCRPQSNL